MANIEFGMKKSELKTLLTKAKSEPLGCAMGKGKDAKAAYLRISKLKGGRKLMTEMDGEFADIRDSRFGTVSVVTPSNGPKVVEFRINKQASQMGQRLIKVVKLVGYKKVRFVFDDGTPPEEIEAEDEVSIEALTERLNDALDSMQDMTIEATVLSQLNALGNKARGQITPVSLADALVTIKALEAAIEAADSDEPVDRDKAGDKTEAEQVPEPLDSKALLAQLALLTGRIPAALTRDPARKAELVGLATRAKGEITAEDLATAEKTLETLQVALESVVDADTKGTGGAVAYGKSRLAWVAVHRSVTSDVEKLRAAIEAEFKDSPKAKEISAKYQQVVDPLLTKLDDELADFLDDAVNASDPQKRAAFVEKARAKIKAYQDTVNSEPFFKELDGNPFVPLTTTATLTKTLATLSAAVR